MNKHGRETHHYLKKGKMLISLDLCILNQGGTENWYQDRHRQETIALLEDCVSERISEFYIKKRARRFHRQREKKEVKPKQEQPKMLQGSTVKIGYKFTKRTVTQRCLLTNSNFATITLFPETLHVYVCEYQPSTVLKTTAQLMYTIKEDTMEPVGTSNYFQRGTSPEIKKVGTVSAVKKRDKLKMLVRRRIRKMLTESCSMESGYDTITNNPTTSADTNMVCAPCHTTGGGYAPEEVDDPRSNSHVFQTKTERALLRGLKQAATSTKFHMQGMCHHREGLIGNDVQKPSKKRKVVLGGESHPNEMETIAAVQTNTNKDSPDIGGREPFKEKIIGPANTESDMLSGRWSSSEIKEKTCEAKSKESERSSFHDDDGDVEMMDLEEVVDLCGEDGEEDVAGGDISCLKDGKPDVECMKRLDALQLKRLVRRNKRFLREIFVGKRPCKRHLDYKQGGYARANLAYEAWYGPFTEDQVDCIMTELMKVYCAKHNRFLEYLSKVLLPEALTKICMDVLHLSQEAAQLIMEDISLCSDATLLGNRY
ncbi:uncharacterized protein LOC117292151 [Asterias rubens]|uniref:uncharacterized protein LOC117292151 n=1 Tax=Asterias rubens TaxID=7604 RepID=UPI0014555A1F|nr:uncharacterized protein LOC117292151 [Asterias rubens]